MKKETPSEAIIAASAPADFLLKAGGKAIVIRMMTPVEQFRFKKVIGKFMDNPGYMLDAAMAGSVRSIDGAPMPFPQSEANVEFILEKLGFEAWGAVQEHFVAMTKDRAEDVDAAKN